MPAAPHPDPPGTWSAASAAGGRRPVERSLRLPFEAPLAHGPLLAWFAARALEGVVEVAGGTLVRTLGLPGGPARVHLAPATDHVACRLELSADGDAGPAVAACRRMFDLDAPTGRIDRHLATDADLAPLVRDRPGLRVPGAADPHEVALLAVMGQQVSVAAARATAQALVRRLAPSPALPGPGPRHLFPLAATVAGADLDGLGMPRPRAEALRTLAAALAEGRVRLEPDADPADTRAALLALPGIGPWTADAIALRALGDRDALPETDVVLRARADERGIDLRERGARWRPWRAYAAQHLWVAGPRTPSAG